MGDNTYQSKEELEIYLSALLARASYLDSLIYDMVYRGIRHNTHTIHGLRTERAVIGEEIRLTEISLRSFL